MKNTVWTMFLITAVFTSFLLGYSVPPLLEVGMIGGRGEKPSPTMEPKLNEQMEEYYRKLLEEEK
jgi:hypothetical protein|tara:strand:+ start:1926 stop:2120 length:195 start_codon:yes stop_codon:yes gene_type:complete